MISKTYLRKYIRRLKINIMKLKHKKHPTNDDLHTLFHYYDELDYLSGHLERVIGKKNDL